MGTVTFLLPDPLPAEAARCLDGACLAVGYDQSPVPTRRRIEDGRLELYNIKDDLGEKHNLAARMPDRARELHSRLAEWRRSVGAHMPKLRPQP